MNTVTPLLQRYLLDHLLMNRVTCIPALDLLALLPDASVDLIATDPPFNIDKAAWDSWATIEDFLEWLDLHAREMKRVLKPNGSLYLFCATKYASKVEGVIENHFAVLNNIRWKKQGEQGRHQQADKEALRAYFPHSEAIIFAEQYGADRGADEIAGYSDLYEEAKRQKRHRILGDYLVAEFNRAGVTRREITALFPSATGGLTGCVSNWVLGHNIPTSEQYQRMRSYLNNRGGSYLARDYAEIQREMEDVRREYEDLRRPFFATPNSPYTDVWEFPTVNTYPGKHLAEKPLAMMRHIVRTSSRPNALVLDPFMGSGTTAEAAILEGRRFIGGDFDKHWVRKANIRAENARIGGAQMALFAA